MSPVATSVTLGVGQRLILVCRHDDHVPLRWYLNGLPVVSGPLMTLLASPGGGEVTLTINRASLAHKGRYQCSNQDDYFDYDFRRVDVTTAYVPSLLNGM